MWDWTRWLLHLCVVTMLTVNRSERYTRWWPTVGPIHMIYYHVCFIVIMGWITQLFVTNNVSVLLYEHSETNDHGLVYQKIVVFDIENHLKIKPLQHISVGTRLFTRYNLPVTVEQGGVRTISLEKNSDFTFMLLWWRLSFSLDSSGNCQYQDGSIHNIYVIPHYSAHFTCVVVSAFSGSI